MKYADHVIIRNQVFRWEEKAPFVPSGKSVLGAIEFRTEIGQIKCHECGHFFNSLGSHLRSSHNMRANEYRERHGIGKSSGLCAPSVRAKFVRHATRTGLGRSSKAGRFLAHHPGPKHKITAEYRNIKATCRAQLLNRIKIIAQELGRTPAMEEAVSIYNAAVNEFGSRQEFLKAASLENNPVGAKLKYPKPVLIELLRDFWVLNQRIPRGKDFSSGSLPSQSTLIYAFGSMGEAFHAAGLGGEYEKLPPKGIAA